MANVSRSQVRDPELPRPKPELPQLKPEPEPAQFEPPDPPTPAPRLPRPKAELPRPKAELPRPKAELTRPRAGPPPKPELLVSPGAEISRLSEVRSAPAAPPVVLESTRIVPRSAAELRSGAFPAVERRPAAFPSPVHPRRRVGEAERWSDVGIQRARHLTGVWSRPDPFTTPFDAEPIEGTRWWARIRRRRRHLLAVLLLSAAAVAGFYWGLGLEPDGSLLAETVSTSAPPQAASAVGPGATEASSPAATPASPNPASPNPALRDPVSAVSSSDGAPNGLPADGGVAVDVVVDLCQQAVSYAHARGNASLAAANALGPGRPPRARDRERAPGMPPLNLN